MIKKSEMINELAAALSKAQAEMQNAKKNKNNPHFKSEYADLSAIIEAIRVPLAKNGLSYFQPIYDKTVVTMLVHSSGQWICSELPIITERLTMQSMGSAITYARRYALSAIVGISQEDDDDDGNDAVKKPEANLKSEVRATPQQSQQVTPKQNLASVGASQKISATKPMAENNKSAITENQVKRLYAIKYAAKVSDEELGKLLAAAGVESTRNLNKAQYDAICGQLEAIKNAVRV